MSPKPTENSPNFAVALESPESVRTALEWALQDAKIVWNADCYVRLIPDELERIVDAIAGPLQPSWRLSGCGRWINCESFLWTA